MKPLLVLASLLTITLADIGTPYNYKPPSTRYGVPIPPTVPSGSYLPILTNQNLQVPIREPVHFTGGSSSPKLTTVGHSSQLLTVVGGGANNRGHHIAPVRENEYPNEYPTSNTGNSGHDFTSFLHNRHSGSGYQKYNQEITTNYHHTNQQAQVEKSFYFFSAPDEPQEPIHPRVNYPVVPAKKNVRILFIKAPSFSNPAPINIPAQPQHQEKTIVYVLVKKPEEQAEINIPAPIPTKPTKPEVYFIKYKNQKEAEEAIANVNQGHGHGDSIPAHDVNNNVDFIQTIKNSEVNTNLDTRYNVGGDSSNDDRINVEDYRRGDPPISSLYPVPSTSATIHNEGSNVDPNYGPPADSGPY